MDNTILLFSLPLKDLRLLIEEVLDEKLREYISKEPQQKVDTDEYLTRKDTVSLLRISLSTLNYYTKEGILQGYRIGGRVLYKTEEVKNAVHEIQSTKYKRRG